MHQKLIFYNILGWSLSVEMQLYTFTLVLIMILSYYKCKHIEKILMVLLCLAITNWVYLSYTYKEIGLPLGIEYAWLRLEL